MLEIALDTARPEPRALHAILRDDYLAQVAWAKKKMVAAVVVWVAWMVINDVLLGIWLSPPVIFGLPIAIMAEVNFSVEIFLLRRRLAELDRA